MQISDSHGPRCRMCGDCCRNGGPALHTQDLPLIEDGTIPLSDIVTLRPGERAYDQPAQTVLPLADELLKIKGRDGSWTCLYFSPESSTCRVYATRPAECAALFCEDIGPLQAMYAKDRLRRADLLPADHPLLALIGEHQTKCDPVRMEALGMAAREGDSEAAEALREMFLFDREVRRLVPERTGMAPDLNDFLFGRPLRTLLGAMHIKVYEMDGAVRFNFYA